MVKKIPYRKNTYVGCSIGGKHEVGDGTLRVRRKHDERTKSRDWLRYVSLLSIPTNEREVKLV